MKSNLQPLYYLFLAPVLHLLAVIFMLVSLSTTYWMRADSVEEHFGLFRICVGSDCDDVDRSTRITDTYRPIVSTADMRSVCLTDECRSWVSVVESVRFLMATSLACALFAFVMSSYYAYRAMTSRSTSVGAVIIAFFCSGVAIIMSSVSCDVYTREVYQLTRDANGLDHEVGYSLILAGAGGAVSLLGGLVALVTGLKMRFKPRPSDHLLHAPPGGYGNDAYGRHGDGVGHVSWVERGSRPRSMPAQGHLPPLMKGKVNPMPPLNEKPKLPPLPESRSDQVDD